MKIKSILVVFVLLLGINNIYSQRDIPALELLISRHRKVQDLRYEKNRKAILTTTFAESVSKLSQKYEEIQKKLDEGVKMGYMSLEFAYTLGNIAKESGNTAKLLKQYANIAYQENFKNPIFLKYYIATFNRVKKELERYKEILIVGEIFKGNFKDKIDLLTQINGSLGDINIHLEGAIFMLRGYASLNMNFASGIYQVLEDFEFKTKSDEIADRIINDFYKTNK